CYKADLLALEGENIEAIETYEEAIKQDQNNTYAIDKLAQLKQKTTQEEKEEIPTKTQTKTNKKIAGYALQAGAFLNHSNADRLNIKLLKNGFDSKILTLKDSNNKKWYIVRSGNYANKKDAQKASFSLRKQLKSKPIIRPAGDW
ncbi:MAG: SPOR domain-containing protein, partial [Desulfobacteraceae bacterium]|nr:SPOR domain-containing protein [Desulfobacteraceae bacterium]